LGAAVVEFLKLSCKDMENHPPLEGTVRLISDIGTKDEEEVEGFQVTPTATPYTFLRS
jgi:hypothetical protein